MVRALPMIHVVGDMGRTFSQIPIAIGLFVAVSVLVAFCAKRARQFSAKSTPKTIGSNVPKVPLLSPKQLIATISQKAMTPLAHGKKTPAPGQESDVFYKGTQEESGLWQKAILMGEKCQPPEFSGVIYYDYSGNRISEMPKSPRPGSMSPLRNFNFAVQKTENSVY
ncbi:uncharacterized protein LOC127261656 [Andrographis paniculata]|uniref:uncharacterized protein LOC127261656 n=1 Tax=Andrographis paniculata TaxID=175694 RepID=UPI0021E70D6A|nr:uncharacterized protein LOC127261656 [Andrographis paniculata]